ncbi:glycoside hydrolase family 18 protein [Parathielavia hyrcaniae]|uniref:Glycoside hydrolase family 18 protein n=1 Tax=Parathielavia hyrcaniae TaxID=113614 RepID=A0AAN6SZ64_9PEZI|nr:glycoside hydrolase family 18 protein [Parathielavia hyrcaniae]
MAEAGCWGPRCLFTGGRYDSGAKKGRCTGTAGYIADAEIAEILNDPSRVVTKFVDPSSNTDILVYDGTDDLQQFHTVPEPSESWDMFKQLIRVGKEPTMDHRRNGDWAKLQCTEPATVLPTEFSPSDRWRLLKADEAWADIVRIYKASHDEGELFMASLSQTLRTRSADCGTFLQDSDNCDATIYCPPGANDDDSGPAAELIWNSLTKIHRMYHGYYTELGRVTASLSLQVDDMENIFAPIPEPNQDNIWLHMLINLITLGSMMVAAPLFNVNLRKLPSFAGGSGDNLKDGTFAFVAAISTTGKDLLPDGADTPWKDEDQGKFSNYMSKVLDGWAGVTERTVAKPFYGGGPGAQKGGELTDADLNTLYNLILDGKLVDGLWPEGAEMPQTNGTQELRDNIMKTFYGFGIPALWRVSRSYAFVLDSGFGCDADKPLDRYLSDATMEATGVCVDGRRYYLVHPGGVAFTCLETCLDNMFSAPPGIERLAAFGEITKEELVRGSVRTWMANGKRNGGGFPDTSDRGTADALMRLDITTPSIVRLPVCSPEVAFRGWEKGSHTPTVTKSLVPIPFMYDATFPSGSFIHARAKHTLSLYRDDPYARIV